MSGTRSHGRASAKVYTRADPRVDAMELTDCLRTCALAGRGLSSMTQQSPMASTPGAPLTRIHLSVTSRPLRNHMHRREDDEWPPLTPSSVHQDMVARLLVVVGWPTYLPKFFFSTWSGTRSIRSSTRGSGPLPDDTPRPRQRHKRRS